MGQKWKSHNNEVTHFSSLGCGPMSTYESAYSMLQGVISELCKVKLMKQWSGKGSPVPVTQNPVMELRWFFCACEGFSIPVVVLKRFC